MNPERTARLLNVARARRAEVAQELAGIDADIARLEAAEPKPAAFSPKFSDLPKGDGS